MNLWSHRFSQNMNKKLSRFLPSLHRAEILTIFCSYFGRNDDSINSFWNCLTFTCLGQWGINGGFRNTFILIYQRFKNDKYIRHDIKTWSEEMNLEKKVLWIHNIGRLSRTLGMILCFLHVITYLGRHNVV